MKRLVIITGASRGIGSAIALEANRRFNQNTAFLLIARNEKLLEDVKTQMKNDSTNKIFILKIDFGKEARVEEFVELIKKTLLAEDLKDLRELYVFYNHGTLQTGSVEQIADKASQEFLINVTSVWLFLASIRTLFAIDVIPTQFHVNISSLLATKVQESLSIYCASMITISFNLIYMKKIIILYICIVL